LTLNREEFVEGGSNIIPEEMLQQPMMGGPGMGGPGMGMPEGMEMPNPEEMEQMMREFLGGHDLPPEEDFN